MEKAKSLLETTFLSVKQIMTEVGLRDKSHFVRNFKITYGLPPARFRTHFLIVSEFREEHFDPSPTARSANN